MPCCPIRYHAVEPYRHHRGRSFSVPCEFSSLPLSCGLSGNEECAADRQTEPRPHMRLSRVFPRTVCTSIPGCHYSQPVRCRGPCEMHQHMHSYRSVCECAPCRVRAWPQDPGPMQRSPLASLSAHPLSSISLHFALAKPQPQRIVYTVRRLPILTVKAHRRPPSHASVYALYRQFLVPSLFERRSAAPPV